MSDAELAVSVVAAVGGILGPTIAVYVAFRLRQVHILVNAHATKQEEQISTQGSRIGQLAAALVAAGVTVPAPTPKTGMPA